MKKAVAVILALCCMLSGCNFWMDGSYSSVVPHTEPSHSEQNAVIHVDNYYQLHEAMSSMVEQGEEKAVLSWGQQTKEQAQADVEQAIANILLYNPFAVYAVEQIDYELGTNGSQNAMSIHISYLQNRVRPERVLRIDTLEQAKQVVEQQLLDCTAGVVIYLAHIDWVDYAQLVADFALQHPQFVMEIPEVTVGLYPEQGNEQIAELKFSYGSSRETLRTMQSKVSLVFTSADRYVTGKWTEEEKVSRLYTFLMNRYRYNIQTSITPAYSLLLHGVGDNRAFAMVYAAMCRQSGVECHVVTGTRWGEPWVWNVVKLNGRYYHIDLLRSNDEGELRIYAGEEMTDYYVWDYSTYPLNLEENE